MDAQLLVGLILTMLPVFELRGGLPIIVEWATRNSVSVWPLFILVLFLNILVIFIIFFFLDFLHGRFMEIGFYKKTIGRYINRARKKADKVGTQMESLGFFALVLFVAIPLPGTGAWTGTLVAWMLGAERWKSIIAIAFGVILAGLIILTLSLGLFT